MAIKEILKDTTIDFKTFINDIFIVIDDEQKEEYNELFRKLNLEKYIKRDSYVYNKLIGTDTDTKTIFIYKFMFCHEYVKIPCPYPVFFNFIYFF